MSSHHNGVFGLCVESIRTTAQRCPINWIGLDVGRNTPVAVRRNISVNQLYALFLTF